MRSCTHLYCRSVDAARVRQEKKQHLYGDLNLSMTLLLGGFACCNLAIGFAVGRYVQRQRDAALAAWATPPIHPFVGAPQKQDAIAVEPQQQTAHDDLAGFLS